MLAKAQSAMGDLLSVVTVSTDEGNPARVTTYLRSLGALGLKTVIDDRGQLSKESADQPPVFPLYGIPVTYLVTRSRRIAGVISGATDWLTPEAQRLLAYYAAV
ncbi:hypothetical protein FBZ93_12030 [Bradyrhizobium macuxiense]|uniref:Uncharacterized protein n=2 Tax=Bradyrhizobium macuxiense TaxID=1755647 RepID=A0A560KX06_9BRAD|nr:hypothetical protein FBZ93_12030 [Bradyrhizobium macuxiense]